MHARAFVVVALVTQAGTAAADDAAKVWDTETRFWPQPELDASAFAGLETGNRTGAGVALGGEVSIGGPSGNVLGTGGAVRVQTGEAGAAAEHWLRATLKTYRILSPEEAVDVVAFPVTLEHRLAWNAIPRLSERRVVWNVPFTREELGGTLSLADISPEMTEGWTIIAMPIHMAGAWWYQPLSDGSVLRARRSEIGATMIGFRPPDDDGVCEIFGGTFADDLDRLDLVRCEQMPLRGGPVRLDAALGSADVIEYADRMLERTGGFTGKLGVSVDVGDLRVGVAADRDYYQTIDDAIVGESRAELHARYDDDVRTVSASAFVARSTLMWTDGSGEIPYDPTYGVDLDATWPLREHVEAQLEAGWARSFYATPGEALPAPRTGVEALARVLVSL